MNNMTTVSDKVYQALESDCMPFIGTLDDLLEDLTGDRIPGDDLAEELSDFEESHDMTVFIDSTFDGIMSYMDGLDDQDALERIGALYGAYIELYHMTLSDEYVLIVGYR